MVQGEVEAVSYLGTGPTVNLGIWRKDDAFPLELKIQRGV